MMINLPPDLILRMQRLNTIRLDVNVPPGTQLSPEEFVAQLYKFVEEIEMKDNRV